MKGELWQARACSLGFAVALSGCGGGGGNPPAASPASLDQAQATAMVAIQLYDSVAGVERMLDASNGWDVILQPPAAGALVGCAGGGSVMPEKLGASSFRLVASNCRLRADDGLVYDGTWTFTITANSYLANGACPALTSCLLSASVNHDAARFGYGHAVLPVLGTSLAVETAAGGVRRGVLAALAGEFAAMDGIGVSMTGATSALQAVVQGVEFRLGNPAGMRSTIDVTVPLRLTLNVAGSPVTAQIDANSDGQVDRTVTFQWSEMRD